jgi:hypothetical protein
VYGAEIWGLDEECKGNKVIHMRFCRKIQGLPNFTVNGFAELDMETACRRGKVSCLVAKYWLRIVQVDEEELVRVLSMASNIKFGSCAKKLSKYLNKLGLGCVQQVPKDNSVRIFSCEMILE